MGNIQILDDASINKIAAGEVIERPASVVKELIENSLDAGADTIRIEVEKSGKVSIQVKDNGCGMNRDDAAMSYVKHATSKIRRIEDLDTIRTLGFRGEALSSIASIARVEIITKIRGKLSGTRVIIQGGKLIKIDETGAADGTTIGVDDLFYNMPVRRKFLKSDSVELAKIIDAVTRIKLGHNGVSISLFNNGKEILSSSAAELYDVIIHIYGVEVAKAVVPVHFESAAAIIKGYISKPSVLRSSLDFQSFFINDRSINSKAIGYALKNGYSTLLPKGRFPIAILKIYLDLSDVDINVHPAKLEVRLRHEKAICDLITNAVRNALSTNDLLPEIQISSQQLLIDNTNVSSFLIKENGGDFKPSLKDTERRLKESERSGREMGHVRPNELQDVKVLGQVDSTYILAEINDGLMIIDQHAAHERVFFEQIRESKRNDSQELIIPVTLELDSREKAMMKEIIPYLEEFGFRVSEFGRDAFAVTAVPLVLGNLEECSIIHDIISDILSEGKVHEDTGIFDKVTKTIACKNALKAGAECTSSQMGSLIKQLFRTENPYTCPHGRPTMISFNRQELDKLFNRR